MRRSEMVCENCIKFDGVDCRLEPEPYWITDPEEHWCAQGTWHRWSERYEEMEPYFWGEWEDQDRPAVSSDADLGDVDADTD